MKLARRLAPSGILLMTGSLFLVGCANNSLGRMSYPQAHSPSQYAHPTGAGTHQQGKDSNVHVAYSPKPSANQRARVAGLGNIQPVSASIDDSVQPVMLPIPISSEEASMMGPIVEVTPPIYVDDGIEYGAFDEGVVYHEGHRHMGLFNKLAAKKHAKQDHKQALRDMGLAGKEAKHKRKERRDIGSHNPYIGRELRMKSHPMYIVEPPDVLYIEALQLLPERPVMGERLVRQDGTISLGYYGQIHVSGLTLFEIEQKIRDRLQEYVRDPQVYVDVAAFNSKVYYVLGQVQQTGRLPVTGKETVLDAITLAGGLTNFADLRNIHVARPNPGGGCDQILHVDYRALADCGDTRTNYQLMPGDRVVVPGTSGFRTNVFFDNFLTPFERLAALASLIRFTME